jgi:hypothetical protein
MNLRLFIGFLLFLMWVPTAAQAEDSFEQKYLQLRLAIQSGKSQEARSIVSEMENLFKSGAYKDLNKKEKNKIEANLVKAKRAMSLQKMLEPCLQGKKDRRSLIQQITQGSFLEDCECEIPQDLFSEGQIDNLVDLDGIIKNASEDFLLKDTISEGLLNSSLAYAKYDLVFLGKLESVDHYVSKLCETCSSSQKETLKKSLSQSLKDLKNKKQKGLIDTYNYKSAFNALNDRAKSLNQSISAIYDRMEEEQNKRIRTPMRQVKEYYKKQHEFYSDKYYQFVGDELGSLLMTDLGKKSFGELKSLENINMTVRGKIIRSQYHASAGPYCFQAEKRKDECEKRSKKAYLDMIAQAKERIEGHTKAMLLPENQNLKEQAIRNPLSLGKNLVKYPAAFKEVCDVIGEIALEDHKNKVTEDRIQMALTVVSIGSMVLGGAGLLIKGASMVAKQGINRMVQASVATGMLSSTGNLGSHLRQIQYLEKEQTDIQNALMAQAIDPEQYRRLTQIDQKLEKARIGLAATAFEFVPLGYLAKLRKRKNDLSFKESGIDKEHVADVLNNLETRQIQSLQGIKLANPKLKNEVDALAINIANIKDAALRKKWFDELERIKAEPEKMKALLKEMREALECHI